MLSLSRKNCFYQVVSHADKIEFLKYALVGALISLVFLMHLYS